VIAEVLKSVQRLPSLPAVVLELLASLNDDSLSLDSLARKISLDQALSASVLRVANSSFYGRPGQVMSARDGIAMLGLRTVRQLVLTASLIKSVDGPMQGSFDLTTYWRHAIGTALCARALAAHLGENPEQAYTAGLLHDIGRLVLATRFAERYAQVTAWRAANDGYLLAAEQEVLGFDHAVVGEALVRHWRLPAAIGQAALSHQQPGAGTGHRLAQVIHVADAVAHALDLSGQSDDLVPAILVPVWNELELSDDTMYKIFARVEQQFEAATAVLTG